MEAWYEPDKTSAFVGNFESKEAFAEKQVVRGHFHASVPEDIVKSYKTVEYLMAHAWYHWPMFDEALRKLLGMVEMAVKQRSEALEIDLAYEYTDKGGKQKIGKKNFYRLIEDLSGKEPKKELKNWLHDVRWLRNFFSHPEGDTLMGGMVIGKIKNIVNLVNLIFLDEADCIAAKAEKARFETNYAGFREGMFVLESDQASFLITGTRLLEVFQIKEDWLYICQFDLVLLNLYDNFSNQRFPPPMVLALKQVDTHDGVFEAIDIKTGSGIKVYPTEKPEHQQAIGQHRQEWNKLEEVNQSIYMAFAHQECGGKVRDFMYEHRWSTSQPLSSI